MIYEPPTEGWDSEALALVGRIVRKVYDESGDPQEVWKQLQKTAEYWNDHDMEPNHRDWEEDFQEKIERVWGNHERDNPILLNFNNTVKQENDVLIINGLYVKGETEVQAMPLEKALQTKWNFDVLVQAIQTQNPRRITKRSDLSDVMMTYFFFDFDMPEHALLTVDFLKDQLNKLENDPFLSKYYAAYTTKHGFRVIYSASEAICVDYWGQVYKYLAERIRAAGIDSMDEQTCDFTRLMRLPNVVRDGEDLSELPLFNLDLPKHQIKIPAYVQKKKKEILNITNFTSESYNINGKDVTVQNPMSLREVTAQIGDWPKKLGSALFHLNDEDVVELNSSKALHAFFANRGQVEFLEKGIGVISMGVLFESLLQTLPTFDGVSNCPHVPPRDDVYYTHDDLQQKAGTEFLDKLVDYFSPETEKDRLLIKAAFCTPMVNVDGGGRPIFIVESSAGQGGGKTTFAELVSYLYDAPAMMFDQKACDKAEDILKQVLSTSGRKSRVAVIDNVIGTFSSPSIASFITIKEISGRRPYGRGVESRRNDITWFITSNNATFDKDMISRALMVRIKAHVPDPNWIGSVNAFIADNRIQILEEVRSLLMRPTKISLPPVTRFAEWEKVCLMSCFEDDDTYNQMIKDQIDRKEYADDDREFCVNLEDLIETTMRQSHVDPDLPYFISKDTIYQIVKSTDITLKKNNFFFSRIATGLTNGGFKKLKKVSATDRAWRAGPRGWVWGDWDDHLDILVKKRQQLFWKHGRLTKS